jgi:type II secretory pathway predicted ATPase ExeA
MYYHHFHLKGPPFRAASPNGAVYFSPTHLEGLATLEWGLSHELNGFTLLTGEAGTGKTTLIYSLLQHDYKRVRIAHIDDPKLSFLEIVRVILTQLNLYSTASTKSDCLEALDRFLKLRDREERVAIIVDESQVLSDDVLEELRLLSNHGQRHERCLQLILVGQPELAERLKKPELRQLNQRISSRAVLEPLSSAQAIEYVECRLSAQGSKCSAIFEPGALKCLLRRSDGIPRKINMLCHSAMLDAYSAGKKKVSLETAKKTAAEYHDSVSFTNQRSGARSLGIKPTLIVSTALASLLLLGLVYPNVWSDWVVRHTVSFGRAIEQTVRSVKRVRTVEQPSVEGHPDSGAKPKAATPIAPDPVELRASLSPGAAAPAAPKSDVDGPTIVPEARIVPAPPEQRSQITVRYGDTLEKLAIRYYGSKSGINSLIDANPQLTNINQLSVGQVIYLPPGVTKPSHNQTSTTPTTALSRRPPRAIEAKSFRRRQDPSL